MLVTKPEKEGYLLSKSDGYINIKKTYNESYKLIPTLCNCCEDLAVIRMNFKKEKNKITEVCLCKEHSKQFKNIINYIID